VEIVVLRGVRARSRHRSEGGLVLTSALAAGLVTIVSIIASELESFFGDEGGQSGEGVQWKEPFRSGRVQVGVLRSARIISNGTRVLIVMEAGERKGGVNEVGCESFPSGAVVCRDAFSLVGGKSYSRFYLRRQTGKGELSRKRTCKSEI
jgi:hypothetical protein